MPRYKAATDNDIPKGARVFLNGEDVTDCACECDTDEGWAMIYAHKRDADGNVTLLIPTSGFIETRKRHGTVEVRTAPVTFAQTDHASSVCRDIASSVDRLDAALRDLKND